MDKLLHCHKRIKESLEFYDKAIYDDSELLKALNHCHKEIYFDMAKFLDLYLAQTYNMSYNKVKKEHIPQNSVLKTL